jgi:hypothetical protein
MCARAWDDLWVDARLLTTQAEGLGAIGKGAVAMAERRPDFPGSGPFIDYLSAEVLPAVVAKGLADLCDGGIDGLSIAQEDMLRI